MALFWGPFSALKIGKFYFPFKMHDSTSQDKEIEP